MAQDARDVICRSNRAKSTDLDRWLPLAAALLFAAAALIVENFAKEIPAVKHATTAKTEFRLWASLLGAVCGVAAAAAVYFILWLRRIRQLDKTRNRRAALREWLKVLLMGAAIAFELHRNIDAEVEISQNLNDRVQYISLFTSVCALPGLVGFMALRSVACNDINWNQSGVGQVRLLARLRGDLRRLLATFGALLALIVVATGVRRRALLIDNPEITIPAEQVIVYGLVFAALLGLLYGVANLAIELRARDVLEDFAALPGPDDAELTAKLRRRTEVTQLVGGGGSWRTLETAVVIGAPLLSALIGTA